MKFYTFWEPICVYVSDVGDLNIRVNKCAMFQSIFLRGNVRRQAEL